MTSGREPFDPGSAIRPEFEMVSVVIPVRNAASTLGSQLEALANQTYSGAWEVIVVDNGSDDNTASFAEEWSDRLPGLRVVSATDRLGCSHARNVGAGEAGGDFIAFCDGDDVVAPGWLAALVEGGKRFSVVGGPLDSSLLNTELAQTWRPSMSNGGLPIALGFLPYAVGANCGARAEVVEALGGWNEDFAVCGDDVDFAWRAQLGSFSIGHATDAVVHYRFRTDLKSTARQFFNYGRAEPRLYRRYRHEGMPPSSLRKAVREWAWIVLRVSDLFGRPERKGAWVRKAAYRVGRLAGSLRQRVAYP